MNDETLEQQLRSLAAPELPQAWQKEILSTVLHKARETETSRQVWPEFLVYLYRLCARNPVTACAMIMLWTLIFSFKISMPVDPAEKLMAAHFDTGQPVYLVSISDEIQLTELLQYQTQEQRPLIP
jgi:hypothetical protein